MTEMKIIARIRTELPEKFGVPRQSGLVPQLRGRVVFEPGYRNPDAVRGLEDFSHIWLIWQFSQAVREDWSPTVRPLCSWTGWSWTRSWARCSMCGGRT